MRCRPTLLILAALIPTFAGAAQWRTVATRNKVKIDVDLASIRKDDKGNVKLWSRELYPAPRLQETGAFSYGRLTQLTEFQCEKRTAAVFQTIYSSVADVELKSETFDGREARAVPPDSTLETVLNYACRPAAKPPVSKAAATPEKAAAVPAAPVAEPAPPPAETKEAAKKTKTAKKNEKKEEAVHETPHWSYTGPTGPDKWGTLGNEFAVCGTGQVQSPIDIRNAVRGDLAPIQFDYKPVPLAIVDNGHSIKVDLPGAGGITVNGESYDLLQFHFHKPSEEKVNGKLYEMVAHFVHQSKAGKLAVVGVLMTLGKEHPQIRTLWTHLPLEKNKVVTPADVKIDPSALLPAKRGYYTFMGSLTTPPCSEGVLWFILKTPVEISKEQLAGFATIYRSNVRPVQPVNGRTIKESR